MNTDTILKLTAEHPEHEQLILLTALSVAWLEPQNPEAAKLIQHYRSRNLPFAALRETALQLFLLAGFQTSLEAAFQIEQVYGHGLNDDTSDESSRSLDDLHDRGLELQASVYRGNVEKLRINLERVSKELSEWTVMIGYGLVMSRPGLPAHYRELLEITILAFQGFPRQLHSHFRGALNMGASPQEIDIVLETIREACPEPHSREALHMWRRLRPQA